MINAIIDLINYIIQGLGWALSLILSILPTSPFVALDNTPVQQYLGMINWFIPIYNIELELAAFLLAVLFYYGYSIVERWIKVIE
jgi:hypothetical protein